MGALADSIATSDRSSGDGLKLGTVSSMVDARPKKRDEDKSWFDTLLENAGSAAKLVEQVPQGLWDLAQDTKTTATNLASIPGTALTQTLEDRGVDQKTAEQAGGNLGWLTGIGTVQKAADLVTGAETPSTVSQELLAPKTGAEGENRAKFMAAFPAVAKLEQGFEDTAVRGGQTIQAGLSSAPIVGDRFEPATNPYVDAYKAGTLPEILVPDVANWALAADLAGGAFGETAQAARAGAVTKAGGQAVFKGGLDRAVGMKLAGRADQLGDTAMQLQRGAGVANKVAGAPQNLITAPVRLPYRWAERAARQSPANAWAETAFPVRPQGPLASRIDDLGVTERVGNVLEPVGQWGLDRKLQYGTRSQVLTEPQARTQIAAKENQPTALLEMDPTEGATAMAVASGTLTPETVGLIDARMSSPPAGRVVELPAGITPEMVATAREHFAGTNPELSGRLTTGVESWRAASDTHGQMRREGQGEVPPAPEVGTAERARFDRARTEEQGADVMESYVERAMADPLNHTEDFLSKEQAQTAADLKAQADAGSVVATARLQQIRDTIRDQPQFAPPAYRPLVKVRSDMTKAAVTEAEQLRAQGDTATADILEQAAAEVATTLRDMQARGQVPDAQFISYQQPGKQNPAVKIRSSPLARKAGSQFERGGTAANYAPEYQWAKWVEDVGRRNFNETAQSIAKTTGTPLSGLADNLDDAVTLAQERRMVPFDPEQLGTKLGWDKVDADTLMVPEPVMAGLNDVQRQQFKNHKAEAAAGVYDTVTRAWKTAVLPLRPAWLVGNIFGNAFQLGMVPGGLSSIGKARREMGDPDYVTEAVSGQGNLEQIGDQRGILGAVDEAAMQKALSESPHDTFRDLMRSGEYKKALAVPFKKTVKAAYDVNQWTDDLAHVSAAVAFKENRARALAETDRLLAEGRITKAQRDELAAQADLSDQQIVAKANEAVGDFKNLSSAERDYIRRAMPFYPWAKHITKRAWQLPFDSPYRVAWTLSLGELFADDSEFDARPDWLRNSVRLGPGSYLRAPWNPFPGGSEDSPLLSPQKAIGSLNPVLQWPITAFGFNPQAGRMTSRPPDGSDQNKMGFIGVGNTLQFLGRQIPQIRLPQDLAGGDVVRYDTGQPRFVNGKPMMSTSQDLGPIPAPILRYATGANIDEPKLDEIQAREAKTARANKRARTRYERLRTRKGI